MALDLLTVAANVSANFLPSYMATQVGSSQIAVKDTGNLFVYAGAAASGQPAVINSNRVVQFFAIPPLAFDVANRGLLINASGGQLSNANVKTVSLLVSSVLPVIGAVAPSGTTIASSTLTASAAGGWTIGAQIQKYGALGSNTQIAVHQAAQSVGAVGALTAPSALTLNESVVNYVSLIINNVAALADSYLTLFTAEFYN